MLIFRIPSTEPPNPNLERPHSLKGHEAARLHGVGPGLGPHRRAPPPVDLESLGPSPVLMIILGVAGEDDKSAKARCHCNWLGRIVEDKGATLKVLSTRCSSSNSNGNRQHI